jgi:hypothetical protein
MNRIKASAPGTLIYYDRGRLIERAIGYEEALEI